MGEAVSLSVEAYLHSRVKHKEGHLTARKQGAARQRGESASTTTTTSSQKTWTPAGESGHTVGRSLWGWCGGKTRQMTPGRPTNCNQGKTSKSQVRRGTKHKNSKEAEPLQVPGPRLRGGPLQSRDRAAPLVQTVKTSRGRVPGESLLSESPKMHGAHLSQRQDPAAPGASHFFKTSRLPPPSQSVIQSPHTPNRQARGAGSPRDAIRGRPAGHEGASPSAGAPDCMDQQATPTAARMH